VIFDAVRHVLRQSAYIDREIQMTGVSIPMSDHPNLNAYFAAANTADGFCSRFSALFDPRDGRWQKIYIIKGGPGTGKSAFMKRAASYAEERGLEVERFYCSSDTRSLDGIRIPSRGIAMLDGTAPHTVDAVYPGAVEEIVNMGMFFDVRALREKTDVIRALHSACAAHHARAKRYLRAAGAMRDTVRTLLRDAYLAEKAAGAAARLVQKIPAEREPVSDMQFVTAISTQGIVHLPTAERMGRCIYVTDRGRASLFFDALLEAAQRRGVSFVRFASPLCPGETEGVWFPGIGTAYVSDRYGCASEQAMTDSRPLNTARFFDAAVLAGCRARVRFAQGCEEALLDGACEALASAGAAHDALEAHYIAAMDFDALNAFETRFLRGFC